jgi:hypothetical protein
MRRLLAVSFAAVLAGCATTPKVQPPVPMTQPPAATPRDFSPTGVVVWKDLTGASGARRAAFDDWRIQGPTGSVTRDRQNRWVGTARGADVVLVTQEGKVTGGDIALSLTFDEEGRIVVEGFWGGKPVKLFLAKNKISGAIPSGPVDLTDMGTGMFNSYNGLLEISGPSDMPQVIIAMLDVMVR